MRLEQKKKANIVHENARQCTSRLSTYTENVQSILNTSMVRKDSAVKFEWYHIPGILHLSNNTQSLDIFSCSSILPCLITGISCHIRQFVYTCLSFDLIVTYVLHHTTYFVITYASVVNTSLHTLRNCTVRNTLTYLLFNPS